MFGVNAPFGFNPARKLGGGLWDGTLNKYAIAGAYATNIFKGDPVAMLADGTIGIGVAGATCVGIFMGCKYQVAAAESSGNTYKQSPMWPASTVVKTGTVVDALILDDPAVCFHVQEAAADGVAAGTPLALADRNFNINFRIGAGNLATGMSTSTINNETEADTATLNMKILDIAPTVENPLGNFAVWLVAWNNHAFKAGVAGV